MLALVYNKTILHHHILSERSFYLQSDTEDLRRHYDSLSDEALLAISRADLTEVAQRCYDAELSARGIAPQLAAQVGSRVRPPLFHMFAPPHKSKTIAPRSIFRDSQVANCLTESNGVYSFLD